tara:strand:- start:499 stop:1302 length:804 start_codon:yes stop_codon:yes gene_type:complete
MSTEYTLSYSDKSEGWPSFYSFIPDFMIGMNSYFYTFKNGNLYRHNTNDNRNEYYGVSGALAPSTITSVIAPRPVVDVKLFKTLTYESNAAWSATNLQTDLTDGSPASIPATYFVQKEGEWFSFIRTNAGTVNFLERSANGIANNTAVDSTVAAATVVSFANPTGSILSIGDNLFAYPAAPVPGDTPTLAGEITAIDNTAPNFSITIDTTIGGAVVPAVGAFMINVKNSVAESHGARGYYMEFKLSNNDITPVELFTVGSQVMKSFP